MNPNNDAYWESRGYDERPNDWEGVRNNSSYDYSKSDLNNRSNQLNSNNDTYWRSRGYEKKPDEWDDDTLGFSTDKKSYQQIHNNQSSLQLKEPSNRSEFLKISGKNLSKKRTKNNKEDKVIYILEILTHWLSIR